MNGLFKNYCALVLCLVVISCGKNEDTSTKVPESKAPDASAPAPAPVPAPSTTPDPRLPDMTGSVPVNLTDKVQFSALADLAGNVFLPLVGDPRVVMHLPLSRTNAIYGDILFGFEDKQGFWGANVPSFEGTGSLAANKLDIIFADDETLFRVVGNLVSDTLSANIYYRQRSATDPKVSFTLPNNTGSTSVQSFTYCTKIEFKCTVNYPVGYTGPTGTNNNTTACPNQPVIDTATPCKTFMNITDSSVKKLGTFEAKYSSWTTLKENE